MKIECGGKIVGISTDEKKTVVKMEIYEAEEVIKDLYEIRSEHIEILIDQDEDDNQTTLGGYENVGEDPAQYGSLQPCCPEMRIEDGICQECGHDHLKHPLNCPVPNPPESGTIFCDECGKLTEEIDARECEMLDGEKKILCPDCLRRTSK